jgi:hypothetical protein
MPLVKRALFKSAAMLGRFLYRQSRLMRTRRF